jgi:hypothetical protein
MGRGSFVHSTYNPLITNPNTYFVLLELREVQQNVVRGQNFVQHRRFVHETGNVYQGPCKLPSMSSIQCNSPHLLFLKGRYFFDALRWSSRGHL